MCVDIFQLRSDSPYLYTNRYDQTKCIIFFVRRILQYLYSSFGIWEILLVVIFHMYAAQCHCCLSVKFAT